MQILKNWSVCSNDVDLYTPPECIVTMVQGEVYNSEKFKDGDFIVTSPIIDVQKDIVITQSGSKYQLGEPNTNYVRWCREQGRHIPTKEEPIKIHRC